MTASSPTHGKGGAADDKSTQSSTTTPSLPLVTELGLLTAENNF